MEQLRQIVLDTETTGLDPSRGDRVIEIGCVELVNRRLTGNNFHHYINPKRTIDQEAINVHGITNEFLLDKPLFGEIYQELIHYLGDAELIIHNAPFDLGFLNAEFNRIKPRHPLIESRSKITDTLTLARQRHPGQRNNLDALCQRYYVDNSNRELHGALLDAEILADVYLAMTGGQEALFAEEAETKAQKSTTTSNTQTDASHLNLTIIKANPEELAAHQAYMDSLHG